ncbi:hypothetical protein Gmet_3593 [Geobacter metallireducens GS-15]|uniref:Uncharacterized protein n=1 Tax=Geobacter metallireducens (strain ATCC 53774 / DSM 7210 / GS-15) TaxID=269799 RepID=J9JEM7_GEOMG|nr:hypothetical protein Gmet_3593 [Geobacter metallireducens GS-15]
MVGKSRMWLYVNAVLNWCRLAFCSGTVVMLWNTTPPCHLAGAPFGRSPAAN